MKKDLSFLKDLLIAHRGLHNERFPENSLGAFKEALKNKKPIELDLHLLSSGEVVVFHDDNLKRMTGLDKKINECTYEEIKALRLLGTKERVPLLSEVLDLVQGKEILDIEFKDSNKAGVLESKTVILLDNYKGKFIVKSFNPLSVLWFKKNRPHFIRGQLVSDYANTKMNIAKKYLLKRMFLNIITKPDFIGYDIRIVNSKIVNKLAKKNIPLILWTIRNKEELRVAQNYRASVVYEKLIL